MTEPLVHLEAPLSPVEDPTPPIRRGHLRHCPIPYAAESEAPDHYAPVRFYARCVDLTGFKRRHHEWIHQSPQGTRCIYCGTLRKWEAL